MGSRLGISNKFPGDFDAAGLGTTHGEPLLWFKVSDAEQFKGKELALTS